MRLAALAVFVLACSSSTSPPPAVPAPAPPANRCGHVADHLLSLMTATARDAPLEELDRVRIQFKQRCERDGWSPQAQQCFLDLTAKEDVDRCASQLTDVQREALETRAE